MRTSQIVLKVPDQTALWAALDAAGITVESEDGPAVHGYSFNELGEVEEGTGVVATDPDGFEFEVTTPVDGWFAVLCGKLDADLLVALAHITVTEWPASVPLYSLPEPTPEEIAAEAKALRAAVTAEAQRRVDQGASFAVPGVANPIPVPGVQPYREIINAKFSAAQGFKAQGITDPVMLFRDGANKNHRLTPDQMLALTMQSMRWYEDVMSVSWAMKDGDAPFENGIPENFTSDEYWP